MTEQPTGITEEELQEMERFVDNDCSDDGWAWNDKMTRLIAEVRRQRAEMPTAVCRMAPGERKEIITSEHFIIYMKQTPPPPPPEMDEADKLEAEILARWATTGADGGEE